MRTSRRESSNRQSPNARCIDVDAEIDQSLRLLSLLFDPTDHVTFRPIEVWTEAAAGGRRKCSRVIFKEQRWVVANSRSFAKALGRLREIAAAERANIFFGVCPRVGGDAQFDLAWQIRTVRVLWADIDDTTVEAVLAKCAAAGLPSPSIVVKSGHGVHLYWLLKEAYIIDDAGAPPPVVTEWDETSEGKRQPRKYFVDETGEKMYLNRKNAAPSLSPKAQHVQDIVHGIAAKIGGDSTHDLARLLRVPGTLNRKEERNGIEPTACEIVECDASRRYSIIEFEALAEASLDLQRRKKIERVALPVRRRAGLKAQDKFESLILASDVAAAGSRSDADFALCCGAVRLGFGAADVWPRVERVGKFAEGGKRYFDRTWESAEREVREQIFVRAEKKASKSNGQADDNHDGSARHVIDVDPTNQPVSEVMAEITNCLLCSGTVYRRAGQPVLICGDEIITVLSAEELAGISNSFVEFRFIDGDQGQFKPLPASYSNTWLNHPIEQRRLQEIKLFTRNPVYTDDWRLARPGFDAESGIYYAGPAIPQRDTTEHLDQLLRGFCWKAPCDRTNFLGVLITVLLVARLIGSKPAALFNGNQPLLGKTILAQIIAILRDGHVVETATYNPNDEEFEKRLGSLVRRGLTTIIIDNAKKRGAQNVCIDSPCLERSITDAIISFRLLGYSTDIRAENSHIFCITANSPEVARDLVTRSVIVSLFYQGDPTKRGFDIEDPEGFALQHRVEILGELIGLVERWKASGMPLVRLPNRFNKKGWANTVGGILQLAGEPDFLVNAEDVASEIDPVRRDFHELVELLADDPQGIWSAGELVEQAAKHGLLKDAVGDGSPRSKETKMGNIATRFDAEPFQVKDRRTATFHKRDGRKGSEFSVSIDDLPNL